MSTSKVLRFQDFRGRRRARLERTLALHTFDFDRRRILAHLSRALELTAADRAGTVWVDEYGPGLVHAHTLLDVGSDEPRRDFAVDFLHAAWEAGVPGVLDVPDGKRGGVIPFATSPRSSFAVSLGSDGLRAWFMVVDAFTPRTGLEADTVEELLFLAGECTGIVLHRDMELGDGSSSDAKPPRFAGWPVLQDVEDGSEDEDLNRRVACRFLVTRAVRSLIEEDFRLGEDEVEQQMKGVSEEISDFAERDHEKRLWKDVLETLPASRRSDLSPAVLALATCVEEQGHRHGAAELYRSAHELAAAYGDVEVSMASALQLGRTLRNQGHWQEALRWYGVLGEITERMADPSGQVKAMDGTASVHIVRGNLPAARSILQEAVPVAESAADPAARGAIFHSLMTVAHTEGALDDAARFGWRSVNEYPDEAGQLRALTALGGVFLEARDLTGAEHAFSIVADRISDEVFKLYALQGLALVAAFQGDRETFEGRSRIVDEIGLERGPPEFHAEACLERGDGYLALGDEALARRWYQEAVEVAEGYGVSEYVIRAENALDRLDRVEGVDEEEASAGSDSLLADEEWAEIRGGLDELRKELAGASG